jgi:hypothetical protein
LLPVDVFGVFGFVRVILFISPLNFKPLPTFLASLLWANVHAHKYTILMLHLTAAAVLATWRAIGLALRSNRHGYSLNS